MNGLLKCNISNGMFPDEYAVEFYTDTNQKVSLFASKSDFVDIDENQNIGLLNVIVYGENDSGSVSIRLPSETLELGHSLVSVNKNAIAP